MAKRTLKLSGTMLRTRITSNMLLFSSSVACQKNPGIRDKGACEATENKEGTENETKQENVKKRFSLRLISTYSSLQNRAARERSAK